MSNDFCHAAVNTFRRAAVHIVCRAAVHIVCRTAVRVVCHAAIRVVCRTAAGQVCLPGDKMASPIVGKSPVYIDCVKSAPGEVPGRLYAVSSMGAVENQLSVHRKV